MAELEIFRDSFREEQLDAIRTNHQNLHGRRYTNAGDGKDPQDYVTLSQLKTALAELVIINKVPEPDPVPTSAANLVLYNFHHTLVADINITSTVTPNFGDMMWVFLTQDVTGGWQITWDGVFVGAQEEIYIDPGDTAMFLFVGTSDHIWQLAAEPVLRKNV